MPHFQQQTGRGEGPFCIEEWGPPPSPTAFSRPQRRRAARPDWWGSRTSPSSTQRAQQSANESPPPAPKPEQTPGGAPRMAKANARWPPAAVERCRRSSLGCQSVAACGEGSGGVRFVLASGGRAKGSGGEREQTADNAKCGLLVSHLLHSCHLVMVVASLAGLRVLLLARVLVQVRVVFLLFVLFVDLVEPAPGPTPVTLGPTCYARCDPDRHLCCRLCYP